MRGNMHGIGVESAVNERKFAHLLHFYFVPNVEKEEYLWVCCLTMTYP
jgi:hypothetical protein